MDRSVVLSFFFLVALSRADTHFPTDPTEISLLEQALHPHGQSPLKLSSKDLDDPNKLSKLAAKLEKMGTQATSKSKRKDKKKRRLFLKKIFGGINSAGASIGKLASPLTSFVGVNSDNQKDYVNAGLGAMTLGLGMLHKKRADKKFNRIHAILEHKFHLNNLYLDSIGVQNDNAQFVDKMLARVVKKVEKTRSAVLAKIHASANPMS